MPYFGSCAEDADVFSDRKPFLFQAPLEKNSALHIYSTFHLEKCQGSHSVVLTSQSFKELFAWRFHHVDPVTGKSSVYVSLFTNH